MDLPALAQHFLERLTREEEKPLDGFDVETLLLMERYAWRDPSTELLAGR